MHAFDSCVPYGQAGEKNFAGLFEKVMELHEWANGRQSKVEYGSFAGPRTLSPLLVTQQPVAPPDASMILMDGLSGNILQFDLLTGAVVSQVAPPHTAQ